MKSRMQRFFPGRQRINSVIGRWVIAASILTALLAAGVGPVEAANKHNLTIYKHGKPVSYLPCGQVPLRSRTAVLMGGGLDVKDAYSWMIDRMTQCSDDTTGKPGNFIVIRAGGNPSYDSFIYKLGPVESVQTVVIPNRESAGTDPEEPLDAAVETMIRNAGAIWLTGGDQGDYYYFWKNTRLERLITEQVSLYGVPIGGTSAGMMILSQFVYAAAYEEDTPYEQGGMLVDCFLTSNDALGALPRCAPPESPNLGPNQDCVTKTIKNDFWGNQTPFLPLLSTVTDSHFGNPASSGNRDRMGRLVTFLAHIIKDGLALVHEARAIGVDAQTALLMEYDYNGKLLGSSTISNQGRFGAAYVLRASRGSAPIFPDGCGGLTFTGVKVRKLPAVGNEVDYFIDVIDGTMTSRDNGGSIY